VKIHGNQEKKYGQGSDWGGEDSHLSTSLSISGRTARGNGQAQALRALHGRKLALSILRLEVALVAVDGDL